MPVDFPSSLQQLLNESGFKQDIGSTTIKSSMGVGQDKVRRRYTKSIDKFSCSIDIEKNDYLILYNFFNTTLNGGVGTFYYDHPITGVQTVFRFIGTPSFVPMGGTWFKSSFTWEEIL